MNDPVNCVAVLLGIITDSNLNVRKLIFLPLAFSDALKILTGRNDKATVTTRDGDAILTKLCTFPSSDCVDGRLIVRLKLREQNKSNKCPDCKLVNQSNFEFIRGSA